MSTKSSLPRFEGVDMSPKEIGDRLRRASDLAGSLQPEARLSTKIDLSARGVAARLREASDLLDLGLALGRAGRNAGSANVGSH
jgi:hypothetical protein